MEVTAVFDIGKTNKKFFLLDKDFNEVHKEYTRFEEITDDDGFPSEDLPKLIEWIKKSYQNASKDEKYTITHVNFSTYGASMVHLDENKEIVTPFYNYLKPLPEDFEEKFLKKNGGQENFELSTSSPYLGMLNSGLQLFYLKYYKPELFKKIKHSVHFPQYLSCLFTERLFTDYTSLGCHTGLWDYKNNRYAQWVFDEGLDSLLSPLVSSNTYYLQDDVKIGVGIHDSSSALVPYYNANEDPFALISTGTWSICMNLFNHSTLTNEDLQNDCLNFMNPKGLSVKASRLFLGDHFSKMVKKMANHFDVDYETYKELKWDPNHILDRENSSHLLFDHSPLKPERFGFTNGENSNFNRFDSFNRAVHHLFDELTDIQIESLNLVLGSTDIRKIFIDGGFSSSEVFTRFIARKLPDFKIYSSSFPLGSTLGAALMVNQRNLPENFLDNVYKVKLISPES